jgi:Spy/CpxP family protein refolding chaperone
MRTLLCLASVAAVLAFVSGAAMAQAPFGGGFGRGGSGMLLSQESVRKELKVDEEQIKKLDDLSAKMRESFQEAFGLEEEARNKKIQELMQENEKAIAGILKPDQAKRLKQISYQQRGTSAFLDPEVAKALSFSDEQKESIQKINEDTFAEMRELFAGGAPDEEGRKKIQALRTAASEKSLKLLSDEQKAKWKELQGEPFKGEIRFGFPGKKKKEKE